MFGNNHGIGGSTLGYATAAGFAALVQAGELDIETAIRHHLTANIYPPVPADRVERAVKFSLLSILAVDEGNGTFVLQGVHNRRSEAPVTARQLYDGYRLEAFAGCVTRDDLVSSEG